MRCGSVPAIFTNNTVKLSKPRFHKQETLDSCAPACLRMVLSSFSLDLPEAELRRLCDCTFDGTDALKVMDAARQLGFINTAKYTLSIGELEAIATGGQFPIVFVDLTPIDGIYQAHALVVISVSDSA